MDLDDSEETKQQPIIIDAKSESDDFVSAHDNIDNFAFGQKGKTQKANLVIDNLSEDDNEGPASSTKADGKVLVP